MTAKDLLVGTKPAAAYGHAHGHLPNMAGAHANREAHDRETINGLRDAIDHVLNMDDPADAIEWLRAWAYGSAEEVLELEAKMSGRERDKP